MNRLSFSILIFLLPLQLWGQLFPLSDHYVNDALTINPASAGNNGALSTVILYRNQWAGFTDAPKRQMVSLHVPVFNDRVGLGLVIDRNTIGIFKETNLMGNYAYRVNLRDGTLALGMGFGFTVHNIAWNELIVADVNDEKLMNAPASSVLPAFSLGAYYYTKKYFFGISMPYFLSQELDQGTGKYKNIYNLSGANYFFSGGCELGLNRTIKLLPSILVKYHPETAVQIDYNAQISFKDKIWLGLGYRNKEMMVAMFQCQINYQIRLACSYDFDLGSMGKYRNGSHEVVLNYIFRYSRKVMGPRHY